MTLDAIAHRYGTDPESVLRWSPLRLGIAARAMMEGAAAREQAIARERHRA